ncbi:hypothetical protein CYMTET_26788 [Cymbomonas tetramitiformis]|uniref:TerD domain-containing protein n=1 Tax=Cymbomonas tetramitiformis TaxID=36881 RepID=A0AAE0FRD2_9CHLO|nr:hypothetical protein CYMTET_26788 [Cymbomonas tetramitiformis]
MAAKVLQPGDDYVVTGEVGSQILFGADWKSKEGFEDTLELSVVTVEYEGGFKDCVWPGNVATDDLYTTESQVASLRHMNGDPSFPKDEKEQIAVNLTDLSNDAQAVIFIVGCTVQSDMSAPESVDIVLRNAKHDPKLSFAVPANCRQPGVRSIIAAVLYRTGEFPNWEGWQLRSLMQPYEKPSWCEIMVQAKQAVKFAVPGLTIADISEAESMCILRTSEDRTLADICKSRGLEYKAPEKPPKPEGEEEAEEEAEEEPVVGGLRTLRIDVGWVVPPKPPKKEKKKKKKKKDEDSDEEEEEEEEEEAPLEFEFNVGLFQEGGENVAMVGAGGSENGVTFKGDDKEVDEEAEAQKAIRFTITDQIEISLAEVPSEVKSMVLFAGNYNQLKWTQLSGLYARVIDADTGTQLALFSYDTRQPEEVFEQKTGIMMLKLYREFEDTNYHPWQMSRGNIELTPEQLETLKRQRNVVPMGDESDFETQEEWEKALKLEWRIRGLSLLTFGETSEEGQAAAGAVAVYDGKRNAEGKREDKHCRVFYPNGDCYIGEYRDSQRCGSGVYMFKYGSTFYGEFKDGHLLKGTMVNADKGIYVGDWLEDKMHGKGTYTYPDGERYEGDWEAGQKSGNGKYFYLDGSVLDGEWSLGQPHGVCNYNETTTYRATGVYDAGIPTGPWNFQTKKTGLKQMGSYKYEKPEQEDEEIPVPKPGHPNYLGLSWVGDGTATCGASLF